MPGRILLVVVDRKLARAAGDAHRKASGGVVVAEKDVGQGRSAFAAGIPGRQERIGLLGGPGLVQRTTFDVHHDEGLSDGADGLQQFVLQAQELQRGAVEAFSGLHVGDSVLHDGGAGVLVPGPEVAGGRTAHHDDRDVGQEGGDESLGDGGPVRVADGATFDVMDVDSLGFQPFPYRDYMVLRLRGGIVAELVVRSVGVGADEGDGHVLLQRQDAVVLQQNHPFPGGLCGQLDVLRRTHEARGGIFVDIRVVEESRLELADEDPLDGAVERFHGHASFVDGFFQEGVAVRPEVHVDARVQRHLAGLLLGSGHAVGGLDAVDALQITDHESLESPLVVQNAGQELRVASGRDAVQGVVGSHHGQGARVDGGLEGGKHVLPEVAQADDGRSAVMAAFRNAVGDEMLQGGDDALGRRAPHHRGSHLGRQMDVLSISLLHAGPARIAGQVDDRAVPDRRPLRPEFGADRPSHLLHELRIPARSQADAGGEHRRADGHVPVRGLLGQHDGNAQPRRVHRIPLQGVVRLRGEGGVQPRLQGLLRPWVGAENGPEHASVPILDEIPVGVGDGDAVRRHLVVHGPAQRAAQLSQLLVDGHPLQEVVRPLLRAAVGILVGGTMAATPDKREQGGKG